ncbi:hypothetical protein TNCV_1277671 [Trichonephila clavipes]|nr:hypothetical protein TNCV_1277671 [Trichonephila clavipes]
MNYGQVMRMTRELIPLSRPPHHANRRTLSIDRWPRYPGGQGIGSWLACHEFESSTTKDPPCRGAMHVKSVESSNVLPLVW